MYRLVENEVDNKYRKLFGLGDSWVTFAARTHFPCEIEFNVYFSTTLQNCMIVTMENTDGELRSYAVMKETKTIKDKE